MPGTFYIYKHTYIYIYIHIFIFIYNINDISPNDILYLIFFTNGLRSPDLHSSTYSWEAKWTIEDITLNSVQILLMLDIPFNYGVKVLQL